MESILSKFKEVLDASRSFVEDIDSTASIGVVTQRQAICAEIAPWVGHLEAAIDMLECYHQSNMREMADPVTAMPSAPLLNQSTTAGNATITHGGGTDLSAATSIHDYMSIVACSQIISDYQASTIGAIHDAHAELIAHVTPNQRTIEQLTTHNNALKQKIEHLRESKIGLKAIIKDKQNQITTDLETLNRMRFDNLEAMRTQAEAMREQANLQAILDATRDDLTDISDKLATVVRERDVDNAQWSDQCNTLRSELMSMRESMTIAHEKQVNELTREISRLKDALTVAEDKVADSNTLRARLRDSQQQCITQSEVIRELEAANQTIRQSAIKDINDMVEKFMAGGFNT